MAKPPLSLRFTILFSLSLSAAYSSSSSLALSLNPLSLSQQPSKTAPKATPSDLLSLLGPKSRSSTINPLVAKELESFFKFLVPFTPNRNEKVRQSCFARRSLRSDGLGGRTGKEEEKQEESELIWWPPWSVAELARLTVDSGGSLEAIWQALDPTIIPVPDVEGSKEVQCQLTRTPYGTDFISEEVNWYFEFLFELIVGRAPTIGLNISLTRYDLFHGHLFIVFHAKEYPALDEEMFDYDMAYCQRGSKVAYDDSMNLRNILWLAPLPSNSSKAWEAPGVLVVLDARHGGIIARDIIPDYVKHARTIFEEGLGDVVADVNYLNVGDVVPNHQLFICHSLSVVVQP